MVRLRVKEIAVEKGMSIASLARKADLDNRTVYRIVHDPFAEITTVTLGRLARGLGVSVKDLIEDAPDLSSSGQDRKRRSGAKITDKYGLEGSHIVVDKEKTSEAAIQTSYPHDGDSGDGG